MNRKKPGIQCSGFCGRYFHGECLGIVGKQLDNLRVEGITWKCGDCQSSTARNRYSLLSLTEDSTGPSRGGLASATVRDSDDERRSVDLDDKQVSRKQLLAAIENVGAELRAIREQQVVLSNSVTFCSDKVSDFEEKLNKIDDWMRATDKILKENTKLKTDLENLESKVNDLDQAGRLNNVEIQGIPEQTNENLNNVIKKMPTCC